jgi:hypothetical protein
MLKLLKIFPLFLATLEASMWLTCIMILPIPLIRFGLVIGLLLLIISHSLNYCWYHRALLTYSCISEICLDLLFTDLIGMLLLLIYITLVFIGFYKKKIVL